MKSRIEWKIGKYSANPKILLVIQPHRLAHWIRIAKQIPVQEHGRWTTDYNVTSLKLDRTGNVWLFIARLGLCLFNNKTQQIVPVNAQLTDAVVIQFDKAGNLYVTDAGNNLIRKVVPASGQVTTVTGNAVNPGSANGTLLSATFNNPAGIAIDGTGNLYVADLLNNIITWTGRSPRHGFRLRSHHCWDAKRSSPRSGG